MTKDKADALEIAVAKRLMSFAEKLEYDDMPAFVQKLYRREAAEFIAMIFASTKETEA